MAVKMRVIYVKRRIRGSGPLLMRTLVKARKQANTWKDKENEDEDWLE
jgi:hypothetical protein